jgi:ribosomal protein S18 acetylase RimI-like enzyme
VDFTEIAALEDAAYRAVPAAQVDEVDGWLLRATPGLPTRRANSVLARDHRNGQTLGSCVDAVERFYAERELPARFQLCPVSRPAGLERVLLDRGYRVGAATAVQTAGLDRATAAADEVTITAETTEVWWRTWRTALALDAARASHVGALVCRIGQETAFAVAEVDGVPAAIGLGVRDQEWLGIFNMATRPQSRHRGAARAVLGALMLWGRERGASTAYLQVERANLPALALYQRAGFTDAYEYRYLTRGA